MINHNISGHHQEIEYITVNPVDVEDFKILKYVVIGKYTVMLVNYPKCTNFEGNKILIFEDLDAVQIINERKLDPHFFKESRLVGRWHPERWDDALNLLRNVS